MKKVRFPENALVWARNTGYHPWPGIVLEEATMLPELLRSKPYRVDARPVFFFGTLRFSWVDLNDLKDFDSNFEKLSGKSTFQPFLLALQQIKEYREKPSREIFSDYYAHDTTVKPKAKATKPAIKPATKPATTVDTTSVAISPRKRIASSSSTIESISDYDDEEAGDFLADADRSVESITLSSTSASVSSIPALQLQSTSKTSSPNETRRSPSDALTPSVKEKYVQYGKSILDHIKEDMLSSATKPTLCSSKQSRAVRPTASSATAFSEKGTAKELPVKSAKKSSVSSSPLSTNPIPSASLAPKSAPLPVTAHASASLFKKPDSAKESIEKSGSKKRNGQESLPPSKRRASTTALTADASSAPDRATKLRNAIVAIAHGLQTEINAESVRPSFSSEVKGMVWGEDSQLVLCMATQAQSQEEKKIKKGSKAFNALFVLNTTAPQSIISRNTMKLLLGASTLPEQTKITVAINHVDGIKCLVHDKAWNVLGMDFILKAGASIILNVPIRTFKLTFSPPISK